jgi:hypothetical protein
VYPQGEDDQGRPGALAFHALFVGRWTYLRVGADPFAFAGALRRQWIAQDRDAALPAARYTIGQVPGTNAAPDEVGGMGKEWRESIIANLVHGHRVIVRSPEPIDNLARSVWQALPLSVRLRASVATWAFDNANCFDLVAVPKLAGVVHGDWDAILVLEDGAR